MAWPTVIDAIIDVIERNTGINVVKWNQLMGGGKVYLTLYNGYFCKERLEYVLKYVGKPDAHCEWYMEHCCIWIDTKDIDRKPIYRGDDYSAPKNKRWEMTRANQMVLYFKPEEVGVPQFWTKNIQPVRKPDAAVHPTACAPHTR